MNIASTKDALQGRGIDGVDPVGVDTVSLPILPWAWRAGDESPRQWQRWAEGAGEWLRAHHVRVQDAVVLVPQIAHLNAARQAWAQSVGGWLPRFETVGTLIDRLPLAQATVMNEPSWTLDASIDALLAAQRLAADPQVRGWRQRDGEAFRYAVDRLVDVAHTWLKTCLALAPADQQVFMTTTAEWVATQHAAWPDGGDLLPGAREQWLTARALAWALSSVPILSLRRQPLFEHQPAAWVALTVGQDVVPGSESALMLGLLRHGQRQGLPVCWTPALVPQADARDTNAGRCPGLFQARDAEDEAQAAAAMVVRAVQHARSSGDRRPVALVAQDRVLTRRVRALLAPMESQGRLLMADESGWKLSTTRAAAAVTRLLAAAQTGASSDEVLDWLISGWIDASSAGLAADAAQALERRWRKQALLSPWGGEDVSPMWLWAQGVLAPLQALQGQRSHTLTQALAVLADALRACGAWAQLEADAAGQSVLQALRLTSPGDEQDSLGRSWALAAQGTRVGLRDLMDWVQQTLEGVNFMPSAPQEPADVVITPMSRAVLRSFSAVILPGADDRQLGTVPAAGWLGPMLTRRLGLAEPSQQQRGQWEAFALLACSPGMVALSRQVHEGEPVAPSPWLTRWWWIQSGELLPHSWPAAPDPRLEQVLATVPSERPQPSLVARDALAPRRVTASAYEQLRACPYRYFACSLLGLRELDELEEGLESSDYGTWLHEVLKRYHLQRPAESAPAALSEDIALWLTQAHAVAQEHGLLTPPRRAYFAPYGVTLPLLAQAYVSWVRAQEASGWRWEALERELSLSVPLSVAGASEVRVTLYGELDRVDRHATSDGVAWRVMDYKTGASQPLKDKVGHPMEDTQLAFYALLAAQQWQDDASADHSRPLEALYLRVHHDGIEAYEHPDAIRSAHALREGVVADLSRIWQGHPMRALGEGGVCEHCDVRGLCRKDHWSAQSAPSGGDHPAQEGRS